MNSRTLHFLSGLSYPCYETSNLMPVQINQMNFFQHLSLKCISLLKMLKSGFGVLILSIIATLFANTPVQAQPGNSQQYAVCTNGTTFAARKTGGSTSTYRNTSCLGSTRNETWFVFYVSSPGTIIQNMSINPSSDIDYAAWGPFSSISAGIGNVSRTNQVACDYSGANGGTMSFTASVGYYYVVISNFSGLSGNVTVTANSGTASISCPNTVGPPSSTESLCVNNLLNDITHTTTVATGISNDNIDGANGLPAGVKANWASNLITISGTPTVSGTFNYSIELNGGIGTVYATGTITVNNCSPNTWTGTTSNLWNVGSNWSLGTVPTSTETFTITTGTPQLNVDYTVGGNMTISGTGTLTVNAGKTLSVAAGGTADFGGKSVTFKSDATGTAQLGSVLGTLSNASNVTMERYIPARRAYRFIAAQATTTTSIKQNWMENATLGTTTGYPFAAGSGVNPTAGYGTQITGASGNTNGFDATVNNNASMFTFNNGWVTSTNTNTTLAAGDAYRLFVRGDRGTDLNNNGAAPTATVLRTTGTPFVGTKTYTLSSTAGAWNLVGNPYQATIDGSLANFANLTSYYYAWDPKVGTRGAYVAYDLVGGTNSFPGSQIDKYFQPSQAFFVQTDAAGVASISVAESMKASASNQTAVFQSTVAYPMLNVTLNYTDSLSKNAPAMDGFKLLFDNKYSNVVDQNDAQKLLNLDENISINQGGNLLSFEKRQMYNAATEILISTSNYVRQQYTVQLSWSNPIDNGFQAQLVDYYTNTTTPINFSGNTNYAYTVDNTIAASKATDRFKIVFVPNAALPVSGIELGGTATDKQVKLSFKALNEREMSNYAIERSSDGISFAKIGTQQPLNASQASATYSFVDNQPILGNNYYRIKGSSINGQIQFSNVAVVKYGINVASVTVVPNPVQGKTVNLKLSQLAKGNYHISVTDAIGRSILKKEMLLDGSSSVQLNLPNSVKAGNYFVKVEGLGNAFVQNFIIQ